MFLMGLEQEIENLEKEIAETPYNKSTEEHIGRLKSKLADKREKLENRNSSSGGGSGYAVEQTGDASVALVGAPSVGKSTLLNSLTGADSETGSYEFTTLGVNPGMMKYQGANIQILDVPGLIEGAARDRGDGQRVLSVVRSVDLIVFVLSPFKIDSYKSIQTELDMNNIRIDEDPPRVRVSKRSKGGIRLNLISDFSLDKETVIEVAKQQGFVNCDISIYEDLSIDRLVDGLMDNRVYLDSIVVLNKIDLVDSGYLRDIRNQLRRSGVKEEDIYCVSSKSGRNLEILKDRIWNDLDLIRVYMDKPSKGVDYDEPLILSTGSTVQDACEKLSGEIENRFKFARVRGSSVDHDSQRVGSDHLLEDEDELRIATR